MKKPVVVFLLVFALALGIFTWIEYSDTSTHAAIEKSPAYATAVADGMTKKTRRLKASYQVNFSYEVDGIRYKLDTGYMDESDAQALMANPGVQIAYATSEPGTAVLKSEYDARESDQSFSGALGKSFMLSLMMALVATAVILFQYPSLRRS
jgi:hypothetical protein